MLVVARNLSILAACVLGLQSVPALADEPSPAPPAVDAPGSPETPASEFEELTRSLEQDAPPAPPPAPVTSPSIAPEISLVLDVAAAWFSREAPDQLGGHDPARTGVTFQQLELHAFSAVDPFFRFDANLVFSLFGVEIEEAYATTLGLPLGLQARAGQFLARFGRRNATHPHSWSFLDQPLVLGKFFGGEGGRGLGLEVSWLAPLGWYLELVTSVTEASGDCCARSMRGGSDLPLAGLEDLLYTVALKQFWDLGPNVDLSLGLSLQTGPNASGLANRTLLLGADLFLRWKPRQRGGTTSLDLLVEAMWRGRELPGRVATDAGGFEELTYRLDREWSLAGRHEWVTGVAGDPLDPEWTGLRQRGAVAVDYRPSHFSRLRLQLGVESRDWQDDLGWMAMLGLEVVVGAHGAHAY